MPTALTSLYMDSNANLFLEYCQTYSETFNHTSGHDEADTKHQLSSGLSTLCARLQSSFKTAW